MKQWIGIQSDKDGVVFLVTKNIMASSRSEAKEILAGQNQRSGTKMGTVAIVEATSFRYYNEETDVLPDILKE